MNKPLPGWLNRGFTVVLSIPEKKVFPKLLLLVVRFSALSKFVGSGWLESLEVGGLIVKAGS